MQRYQDVYKVADAVHGREHANHVLKILFQLRNLALILKEVGNLFQTFPLHVDSLIWFRYMYQMIVCV